MICPQSSQSTGKVWFRALWNPQRARACCACEIF